MLRSVARSITARPSVVGPNVAGSVRWAETERHQRSFRIRPDQYVGSVATKDFAIPANRVLRGVLEDVRQAAKRFLASFGKGAMREQVERIRDACEQGLKNPYLRDIPRLGGSDKVALRQMRGMRHKGYKTAAKLAAARAAMMLNRDTATWGALAATLDAQLLAPLSVDHLFEVYTLVKTLTVLESSTGAPPRRLGLIRKRREAVAVFEFASKTIAVYFDQSPVKARIAPASWYATIMKDYPSWNAVALRPDIAIAVTSEGDRRVVLVECKNSDNPNYVGRGVYKLIAYLDDFRNPSNPCDPALTGILSVPDFPDPPNLQRSICLANPQHSTFDEALRRHVGLDGTPPPPGRG